MRVGTVTGLGLLLVVIGTHGGRAADWNNSPSGARQGFLSEFRFGLSSQDPWGAQGRSDSANLTGEILFAKPFTTSDLFTSYFIPRPHMGASLNVGGATSFAYAGLSWTVDVTPTLFVEGSIGGAVHDGDQKGSFLSRHHEALGCSPLFRESGSVGVRLSANWSVMATVERLSSAGTCSDNRGLTNVGARVGYSF